MKCENCGVKNKDNASFCQDCGKKLINKKKKFGWRKARSGLEKALLLVVIIFGLIFILGVLLGAGVFYLISINTPLNITNGTDPVANYDNYTLTGLTSSNAIVTINESDSNGNDNIVNVTADQSGAFSYALRNMPIGNNTITIVAKAPSKTESRTAIVNYDRSVITDNDGSTDYALHWSVKYNITTQGHLK